MDRSTIALSLTVKDGNAALDFYTRAFNAKELYRMPGPDGGVMHAEFAVGNFNIYLSEEFPDWKAFAHQEGEISSCLFGIECDDCDQLQAQAVKAGATQMTDPEDQIWGWRTAMVLDPYGYRWNLRTFIEEVSPEEIDRRVKAMLAGE